MSLTAIGQQIRAGVALYRAQFPTKGKWPAKTPLVTKDNITLNHLASLQSGFGTDFQRFDTYVQSALGPHITVTALKPPAAPVPGSSMPPALPVPWK